MDRKLLRMAKARLGRVLEPALKVVDARRRGVLPRILQGIMIGGTTVVAEIARHMCGDPQEFEATRKSIEKHLNSGAWDDRESKATAAMERWVGRQVRTLTPIWVDNSEIAKPYARKMEGLSRVRDADQASRRRELVTEPGYWKLDAQAEIWKPGDPVPLAQLVYGIGAHTVGHLLSENEARATLYDRIAAATEGRGLIVEDRGFDGDVNYQLLRARKLHFLIRQVGERYVQDEHGQTLGSVRVVGERIFLEGQTILKFKRRGRKENWAIQFGYRSVRLPHVEGNFWLIGIRHLNVPVQDDRWIFLLTTVPIPDVRVAERLIRAYVRRWKIEEAIRFLKSDLGLEAVRTLKFRPLRRLVQLAYWAMLLVAFILKDASSQTVDRLEALAQIIPKEADFLYYRVRWALAKLLDPLLAPLAL